MELGLLIQSAHWILQWSSVESTPHSNAICLEFVLVLSSNLTPVTSNSPISWLVTKFRQGE